MKIENATVPIVCDIDNCGRLSTYRLTFENKATYFVCEKCLKEMKDALTKGANKNEKKK